MNAFEALCEMIAQMQDSLGMESGDDELARFDSGLCAIGRGLHPERQPRAFVEWPQDPPRAHRVDHQLSFERHRRDQARLYGVLAQADPIKILDGYRVPMGLRYLQWGLRQVQEKERSAGKITFRWAPRLRAVVSRGSASDVSLLKIYCDSNGRLKAEHFDAIGKDLAPSSDPVWGDLLANARRWEVESLVSFSSMSGRICPAPSYLRSLFNIIGDLVGEDQRDSLTPRFLAGWDPPHSDDENRCVLRRQIEFAAEHDRLEEMSIFLRSLKDEEWHHSSNGR